MRVQELRKQSADAFSDEFKAAMNRFMSLVRHATPEEVAEFDAWRAAQQAS